MNYRYLPGNDADAVVQSTYPQAQRLNALSDLLDGDLLWDESARTMVYVVDAWIDGTGYGRRLHTCAAWSVTGDNDLAFGFSRAAKTADPELVRAAADEILDMVAAGVAAANDAAASQAITAVLHSGLAESPSRKPMFAALRAQQAARTVAG
ncbi:hypothetical protein [Glycomyces harbinensis]|uniref:Uncharacterized protein n=1 Tax=Glycomyces harbinensis TaxID=58114 RepID=A0A1G6SJT5_9ACTN|nr:hypothetical protein [Glycomyces harbinensis]SDD16395.1 hypothetical protein SAMN05216270_102108 [Glycomyces harbinensis]